MLLSLENIDAYQKLFGMNDRNMAVLEQELSVVSALRGQELQFRGDAENVAAAETAVARLITLLQHGETVDPMRIRYVVSLVREGKSDLLDQLSGSDVIAITHRGRPIRSKTLGQRAYVEAVRKHELTLAVGAGVVGALLMLRPMQSARALTVLLGIGMMLEGVLNLCVALFSIKIIRHQRVDGAECRVE